VSRGLGDLSSRGKGHMYAPEEGVVRKEKSRQGEKRGGGSTRGGLSICTPKEREGKYAAHGPMYCIQERDNPNNPPQKPKDHTALVKAICGTAQDCEKKGEGITYGGKGGKNKKTRRSKNNILRKKAPFPRQVKNSRKKGCALPQPIIRRPWHH